MNWQRYRSSLAGGNIPGNGTHRETLPELLWKHIDGKHKFKGRQAGLAAHLGKTCIHHSQDRLGLHIFFLPCNYFLSCGPFTGAVFSEQRFFGRLPGRSEPTMPESRCHSPTQEVAQPKCVDINSMKICCIIWNSWVGRASRKGHLCYKV